MNIKRKEIIGLLLIIIGILTLLSLASYNPLEEPTISSKVVINNWMGIMGVYISHYLIKYCIGIASYIIPLLLILWGWWAFSGKNLLQKLHFTIYVIVISIVISGILAFPTVLNPINIDSDFKYSGLIGGMLTKTIYDFTGISGTIIIYLAVLLISSRLFFSQSFYKPLKTLFNRKKDEKETDLSTEPKFIPEIVEKTELSKIQNIEDEIAHPKKKLFPFFSLFKKKESKNELSLEFTDDNIDDIINVKKDKKKNKKNKKENLDKPEQEIEIPKKKKGKYILPHINLLEPEPVFKEQISKAEMDEKVEILERELEIFKVHGKVVNISPGPVITQYEIEPAPGIRVSKIAGLSDDLARILKAKRIRIVAPIPGKSVVGIEIPNKNMETVFIKSIVKTKKFKQASSILTVALGKTSSGEVFTIDLAKMPHLLIAGATGSGKSVAVNMIIASILYRARPDQVKFVMIDPKKLELAAYKVLAGYHLTTCESIEEQVVTKPENAIVVLKSVELEMERRYDMLSGASVRNIVEYNEKILKGLIDDEHLPYIVVVIDELADLMMTSSKEVEAPIIRLAQMARAVGIHLIVATQRPSVNVITGIIKANFPARMAFQVTSKIDSRTILDFNGAEKLLGRGDMLLTTPQEPEPKRLHSAYISLEELERILKHITSQPSYENDLLPAVEIEDDNAYVSDDFDPDERDVLFDDAVRLVVNHQQGSVSLLQRRLRLGYARAGRIIDQMERAGIVGPHTGSKARDVLVEEDYLDLMYGDVNDIH